MSSTYCFYPWRNSAFTPLLGIWLLHIWRICIVYILSHPFIKSWIYCSGFCKHPLPWKLSFLHAFGLCSLTLSYPSCLSQAQIQLDCGEDNICVPDLKLAVYGWGEITVYCCTWFTKHNVNPRAAPGYSPLHLWPMCPTEIQPMTVKTIICPSSVAHDARHVSGKSTVMVSKYHLNRIGEVNNSNYRNHTRTISQSFEGSR